MSNMNNATTWLLAVFDSDLSTTQKLICCYLRTHMNDYRDVAWPSVGRIAAKCNLTERAVYKNLPQIREAGFLIKNGASANHTIIYAISTPELDSPLNDVRKTPERGSPELTKELTNKPPPTPPKGGNGVRNVSTRKRTIHDDLSDTTWAEP